MCGYETACIDVCVCMSVCEWMNMCVCVCVCVWMQ